MTSGCRLHPIRTTARPLLALAVLLLIVMPAVAQDVAPTPDALDGLDAREAVALTNAWKGHADVTSFATPEAVHVEFPNGQQVRVAMPDDVMLVSVAPYLTRTHPCSTHYMSSCQGELVATSVDVRATLPDGTIVLDDTVATGANGFLDLWLPREQAIVLSLEIDGYATEGFLTTFSDSPTCVTTMQLARAR